MEERKMVKNQIRLHNDIKDRVQTECLFWMYTGIISVALTTDIAAASGLGS